MRRLLDGVVPLELLLFVFFNLISRETVKIYQTGNRVAGVIHRGSLFVERCHDSINSRRQPLHGLAQLTAYARERAQPVL